MKAQGIWKNLLKSKSPTFLQVRAGKPDRDQQLRVYHTYLVHTHAVQSRHSHRGQLIAIVSQAQLTIAIVTPAIHLRKRKGENGLLKLLVGRNKPIRYSFFVWLVFLLSTPIFYFVWPCTDPQIDDIVGEGANDRIWHQLDSPGQVLILVLYRRQLRMLTMIKHLLYVRTLWNELGICLWSQFNRRDEHMQIFCS